MPEQLAVFIDRNRLGTLTLHGLEERYEFDYAPSWLADNGFAISPHLTPGKCRSGSLKRFLANLLPEGKWLDELSLDNQISKNNIFGLISILGLETTGALIFRNKNDDAPIPTSFRAVSPEELQNRLAIRQQTSIANWDGKPRLSVAGVQDKLPVLINPNGEMGFGEGDLASTHILKFGRNPEMHLVINEFICMQLARMLKLPVADVTLSWYNEPVLIVKRFDRRWAADRVERLHLIDGCQILDLPPTYKYERPFGKSGEGAKIRIGANLPALFAACRHCRIPARAIKDVLNWILFQLLIGNSDAHGKNISFLVSQAGIDIAPAYDLVNVEIYGEEYDWDLSMAIGDTFSHNKIFAYQLAEMCDDCKLPQRQVAVALKGLCDALHKSLDVFSLDHGRIGDDELFFARKLMEMIRINTDRFLEIASELPHVRL